MKQKILFDILGWGFILWLFGYVLGIVFFFALPAELLGWAIMPFGIVLTLWVLIKKIKSNSFNHYLALAIGWTLIAIIADYFLLVKVFQPVDGYYKLDVYLYYLLTFLLPLIVGWQKKMVKK